MLAFDLIRARGKYISLDEQDLLETLLEAASPPMRRAPRPCITFLPLLRDCPHRDHPLRGGSRYRSVTDPGVIYGAQSVRNASAD